MPHAFLTRRNGLESGPYSGAELRVLVQQGQLCGDDEVKRDDVELWFRAGEVKGLFPQCVPSDSISEIQTTPSPSASKQTEVGPSDYAQTSPHRLLLVLIGGTAVSLITIALSSFLPWIQILSGGMIGIRGDGKIVLVVSLSCLAFLMLAASKRRLLPVSSAFTLAWGIAVIGWMGKLIYRTATVVDELKREDGFASAIAAAFST